MKEGFKSVDEILLEVAKEEGLSIREIKDIWRHQKVYVKKRMEQEGVYAIFIPYIGTLSLNIKQYTKEVKGKTKTFYKDFIDKVKLLITHEEYSMYKNAHKKITGVSRLARYIINHYNTGLKKSRSIIEHKKCWDIISKHSNGAFEKNKEE